MTKLEHLLWGTNRQLYSKASNPLKSHGPDHHWRVFQTALRLAKLIKAKYDPDILAAAALLHDMAAYYPEKSAGDGHDLDRTLANEVLRSIEFPASKLDATVEAIANHGSDPKYKRANESIETTILRDADKLDAFGPIGVARILMVRTLRGDTLPDIVADFHTGGHLRRKWESISAPQAKQLGQAEYEYSVDFFARLAASLSQDV